MLGGYQSYPLVFLKRAMRTYMYYTELYLGLVVPNVLCTGCKGSPFHKHHALQVVVYYIVCLR